MVTWSLGPSNVPRWSYASGKVTGEFLVLAEHRRAGLPATVVRCFNTCGPRQQPTYGMVVPRFLGQALRGEPLTVFGDGRQSRCFSFVDDVVGAVLARLLFGPQRWVRCTTSGPTTRPRCWNWRRGFVRSPGSASRVRLVPYHEAYGDHFEDVRRRVPDLGKIQRSLGFSAAHRPRHPAASDAGAPRRHRRGRRPGRGPVLRDGHRHPGHHPVFRDGRRDPGHPRGPSTLRDGACRLLRGGACGVSVSSPLFFVVVPAVAGFAAAFVAAPAWGRCLRGHGWIDSPRPERYAERSVSRAGGPLVDRVAVGDGGRHRGGDRGPGWVEPSRRAGSVGCDRNLDIGSISGRPRLFGNCRLGGRAGLRPRPARRSGPSHPGTKVDSARWRSWAPERPGSFGRQGYGEILRSRVRGRFGGSRGTSAPAGGRVCGCGYPAGGPGDPRSPGWLACGARDGGRGSLALAAAPGWARDAGLAACGASLGFLCWNRPPARLYFGNAGVSPWPRSYRFFSSPSRSGREWDRPGPRPRP